MTAFGLFFNKLLAAFLDHVKILPREIFSAKGGTG